MFICALSCFERLSEQECKKCFCKIKFGVRGVVNTRTALYVMGDTHTHTHTHTHLHCSSSCPFVHVIISQIPLWFGCNSASSWLTSI